jgi:hypothetical protein
MEKYCITLEQARELFELGASVKFGGSVQSWYEITRKNGEVITQFDYIPSVFDHLPFVAYPAYNVGELGKILDIGTNFVYKSSERGWGAVLEEGDEVYFPTEAQARGDLLIHLLENNLI